ncbi:MAG: sigma-70 family RNA polymerase sigma factor [Rhizobacter sp.]|nr:sigma-70 family RNA polymerase sigma factor [Rhizobacter sp.]
MSGSSTRGGGLDTTGHPPPPGPVTRLLKRWAAGDAQALDQLVPLVYDELRRLAARHLHQEREGHTLTPPALVHEAFMRLSNDGGLHFDSRAQFFGLASRLMRHVLIDHARARAAHKRGTPAVSLDELGDGAQAPAAVQAAGHALDLLALDEALQRLEQLDPQQCRVVELRFFGGLSVDETAAALAISPASVKREWASARAWLLRALAGSTATAS